MKNLSKILVAGFLAFMGLAVGQRWGYFSSAWFGDAAPVPELTAEDQRAAADTVRLVLTLMRHFYASGGDPRFPERMPASDSVIEEMRADIDYLARNQRTQEPVLEHLEITAIETLEVDRVEIRTREIWRFRISWAGGAGDAEPARVQTLWGRYLVVRETVGWRLAAWDFGPPETVLGADRS